MMSGTRGLALKFVWQPAYYSTFALSALGHPQTLPENERHIPDMQVPANFLVGFNRIACLNTAPVPNGDAVYYCNAVGELRRYRLTTGKSERIRGTFPSISAEAFKNVSANQKEIVYQVLSQRTGVFVLDNPWQ